MTLRTVYLIAAAIGLILPYTFVALFVLENGSNQTALSTAAADLFNSRIASFVLMDLLVSAVVFWIFMVTEGRRAGMKFLWGYLLATLLVGVSFALPLFLYHREGHVRR